MTIRAEILAAIPAVTARNGSPIFSPQDVVDELRRRNSPYKESGIRTHVTSRMCGNAPDNHAVVYDDLERLGHGQYRLRRR